MIDPRSEVGLTELNNAIRKSNLRMEPFRDNYKQLIAQYVGSSYSPSVGVEENPLNLLEVAATIYTQSLMAKAPQVTVRTKQDRYKAASLKLEALINQELKSPAIKEALQRAVIASIFGMGLVKVGIKSAGTISVMGEETDYATPYLEPILLENWVQDMSAATIDEADYYGHYIDMRYDDLKDNPDFDEQVRKEIRPTEKKSGTDDPLNDLSGDPTEGRIGKWCRVLEVFLRREKLIVTYYPDYLTAPLMVRDWEGPPGGPCHALFYNDVEGNSMPLAPALTWKPLHEMANSVFRQIHRQAERSKQIGIVPNNNEDDARKIMDAKDGEVVSAADPQAIVEQQYGGIDQRNFAYFMQLKKEFSWAAGNLDTLGGLGSMANTATQDQILNTNSSARITAMSARVSEFTKRVVTDFAYWMWTDPAITYEVILQSPMGPIPSVLQPDERGYDFFLNELELQPYSMTEQPPSAKLSQVSQVMTQIILPMAPMLQQAGITPNVPEFLKLIARYSNMPEIADLVTVNGQPLQMGTPDVSKKTPMTPPVKVSTENRVSRGAGGMQGDETTLINQMMAQGGRSQSPA
jgi:hypothetical protein